MANELYQMRTSQNIPAADMVAVVKGLYPRFDKPLLSKCQHTDLYGIDLRADAMDALRKKYSAPTVATDDTTEEEPKPRKDTKPDTHRLKCRIMCRLEDDEYLALKRYVKEDGYDTMQAWLVMMIRRYLKRKAANNREE